MVFARFGMMPCPPTAASTVAGLPLDGVMQEHDGQPDPADAEVMQSLMSVGSQSALEFLA